MEESEQERELEEILEALRKIDDSEFKEFRRRENRDYSHILFENYKLFNGKNIRLEQEACLKAEHWTAKIDEIVFCELESPKTIEVSQRRDYILPYLQEKAKQTESSEKIIRDALSTYMKVNFYLNFFLDDIENELKREGFEDDEAFPFISPSNNIWIYALSRALQGFFMSFSNNESYKNLFLELTRASVVLKDFFVMSFTINVGDVSKRNGIIYPEDYTLNLLNMLFENMKSYNKSISDIEKTLAFMEKCKDNIIDN